MSERRVYTDGFKEITQDEFFALQDRLCAGDPVALAYVLIQQRQAPLPTTPTASHVQAALREEG